MQVDRESPTDRRGWAYLTRVSSSAPANWSPKCKLSCLWRRRRWTRQRRKLQPSSRWPPQVLPPGTHAYKLSCCQQQCKNMGHALQELGGTVPEAGDAQGMVIVATMLCSTMRGARLQEYKVLLPSSD